MSWKTSEKNVLNSHKLIVQDKLMVLILSIGLLRFELESSACPAIPNNS